jgi:hypothetical protein
MTQSTAKLSFRKLKIILNGSQSVLNLFSICLQRVSLTLGVSMNGQHACVLSWREQSHISNSPTSLLCTECLQPGKQHAYSRHVIICVVKGKPFGVGILHSTSDESGQHENTNPARIENWNTSCTLGFAVFFISTDDMCQVITSHQQKASMHMQVNSE